MAASVVKRQNGLVCQDVSLQWLAPHQSVCPPLPSAYDDTLRVSCFGPEAERLISIHIFARASVPHSTSSRMSHHRCAFQWCAAKSERAGSR